MDRREFVACAVGLASTTLARPRQALGAAVRILDLEDQCAFRESLMGYERALATWRAFGRGTLIVPAALTIPAGAIQRALAAGSTVILESGAAFLSEGSAEFRAHRAALRQMRVTIQAPVSLWPARRIPYVELTWPRPTWVRDFSRVVPVRPGGGAPIAHVNGLPVGLRRGMLVFVGWPIGIGLWAGDIEARRWLYDVLDARGRIGVFS